uniref:(California timema) hypothetical protein n=1 Tax=Timema californicum TaxID=61474 RepID=A0A7R9J1N1_TIMCA|nr:unnamed protein product [Timema californicum]
MVDANVPANTSLNTFIRDHSHLKGTKNMCHEGGCGACIVSVTCKHPVTAVKQTYAVNSCLLPVFSCHGLAITTIEGIGNKKDGYNIIQKTLAHFNGSQCGYCSPGMVMNMYSLSEGKDKNLTMKEVENSFGGNICRCTGYRPILDAFKSLCVDAPPELKKKCADIEDIYKLKTCPKNGKPCQRSCEGENTFEEIENNIPPVYIALPGSYWFRVTTPKDVFEVLKKAGDVSYMFVCGNTAHAVTKELLIETIQVLENTAFKVRAFVCDLGPPNRKLMTNLRISLYKQSMKNPSS